MNFETSLMSQEIILSQEVRTAKSAKARMLLFSSRHILRWLAWSGIKCCFPYAGVEICRRFCQKISFGTSEKLCVSALCACCVSFLTHSYDGILKPLFSRISLQLLFSSSWLCFWTKKISPLLSSDFGNENVPWQLSTLTENKFAKTKKK